VRRPLTLYSLMNTGANALVPPVVVGLLLPAGFLAVHASGDAQAPAIFLSSCFGWLVPVLASWWPLFVSKERIEGDGRELLYFLKRRGESATAVTLVVSYWILLVPLVLLAVSKLGYAPLDVLILLARCLFLAVLAFWASFVFSSSPLALIVVLVFNLALMQPIERSVESLGPTLALGDAGGRSIAAMLIYVVAAAVMLVHGEARSRAFTD